MLKAVATIDRDASGVNEEVYNEYRVRGFRAVETASVGGVFGFEGKCRRKLALPDSQRPLPDGELRRQRPNGF